MVVMVRMATLVTELCYRVFVLSVPVAEIDYREMSGLSLSTGIGKVARLHSDVWE
jgi:hypothetical protein